MLVMCIHFICEICNVRTKTNSKTSFVATLYCVSAQCACWASSPLHTVCHSGYTCKVYHHYVSGCACTVPSCSRTTCHSQRTCTCRVCVSPSAPGGWTWKQSVSYTRHTGTASYHCASVMYQLLIINVILGRYRLTLTNIMVCSYWASNFVINWVPLISMELFTLHSDKHQRN